MRQRRPRGFTLFEIMAAVAIVGILAAIGYVSYRKLINHSHVAEANEILSSIKQQEERYSAETGSYIGVSPSLATATNVGSGGAAVLYPHCVGGFLPKPSTGKVAWGGTPPATCVNTANGSASWTKLNIETHGPVYYGYSLVGGVTGAQAPTVTIAGTPIGWPNPPTGPWFIASAVNDTDGNGVYMGVYLSSFDNEVRVDNEAE